MRLDDHRKRFGLRDVARSDVWKRHTYASTLISAGESVTVVSKRLGHASAVETLETYSHLWPDSDEYTISVLDAAYARHVESTTECVFGVSRLTP